MNRIKAVFLLAMVAIVVAAAVPGYGDDVDDAIEGKLLTAEGAVTAVDMSKQTITIQGIEEMTFSVTPDTQLTKDAGDIELSDISKGNYAEVGYHDDPSGAHVANSIFVKYDKV